MDQAEPISKKPNGRASNLRKKPVAIIASVVGLIIAAIVALVLTGRGASAENGQLGHVAPSITGPEVNTGKPVSLNGPEFANRWVLVNFGATYCVPCRLELPQLQELAAAGPKYNAKILTVDIDPTDAGSMATWFQDDHVPWPAVNDSQASVAYGARLIPESFLVAPDHEVAAIYHGMITATTVEHNISQLSRQLGSS